MALRIRTASLGDARAIAEVHVEGWRWAYRGQIPDAFIDGISLEERETMWREVLSVRTETRVSVAELAGRVVGFAAAGAPDDEHEPHETGELHAIYLVADQAGLGLGRELLAHAEGSLRDAGYGRAVLWVLETNDRARGFYERNGWRWDGTVSTHRFDCAERPVLRYARGL